MDAIELLTADHEKVKKLFGQFEEAGERAFKTKLGIFEKVVKELKIHSQLEERIFYPATMEQGDKEAQELVREGIEEHRVADYMMERLQAAGAEDATFAAKFKVLMENVEHHIEEEEGQLFPKAKKALGEGLDGIGDEMQALKRQLRA
jgi:hemerythrin superfamily protein